MSKNEKVNITVNDLKVMESTISALSKSVDGMKISIDDVGMKIYTRNTFARFHITSNCIVSDSPCELCINEVNVLLKTLKLVNKQCKKDTNDLTCEYDGTFFHFKSKNVKTKIGTVKERVIQNSIDQPINSKLTPVFEFKTTGKTIKEICTNRFIFNDIESARVYLVWGQKDMHNNVVYAELNNRLNELNSSLTLPLGDITMDSSQSDRDIILDFDRLKALNLFDCDDVLVQLLDKNILVSESQVNGKDGIFTKLTVYNSMRKS